MEHFELDRTDEEREELVKQWIKDYWLWVVGAVLLAVAMVYGLNYYRQSQANAKNESAVKVQQVLSAVDSGKLAQAKTLVTDLQTTDKASSFPVVATFSLAKKYFDAKDYTQAISQYDWVITSASDIAMRDIARLRKARAQANNQQINEAISTLSSIEDSQHLVEANLLKGDLLLADKQYDAAKKAYESITGNSQMTISPDRLKQRIELVNIKQQASGN